MRRLNRVRAWMVFVGVLAVLLIVFLVFEWMAVPVLVDPRPSMDTVSVVAAMIGVGLLTIDAVAPVPSSAVMIALGAKFGFVGGLALSVVGSVCGFALGYLIGLRSRGSVASLLDRSDVLRVAGIVRRWGVVAVVASRPLPLVAETVAFSSGAFGMRPVAAFAAAAVGTAGPAAAFSYAGWRGSSTGEGALVFVLVGAASCVCWAVGRRLSSGGRR